MGHDDGQSGRVKTPKTNGPRIPGPAHLLRRGLLGLQLGTREQGRGDGALPVRGSLTRSHAIDELSLGFRGIGNPEDVGVAEDDVSALGAPDASS